MPLRDVTRLPAITEWPERATTDPDAIGKWFAGTTADVGIVTGRRSGVWVLDVDVKDGKGGDDSLAELEGLHGPLPDTVQAITGTGGIHYYFRHPPGLDLRNSADDLGPGLDVRATGGYVVAPPTVNVKTGRTYAWDIEHHPDDVPVADAPGWLLELLREPERIERTEQPEPGNFADATLATDRYNLNPNAPAVVEGLLTTAGWERHHIDRQGVTHMTRPGKDRREGTSATIGALTTPSAVRCFTSSAPPLQAETSYDPSDLLALLCFQGDPAATDEWLVANGWGLTGATPQVTTLGPIRHIASDIPAHQADGFFVDWAAFLNRERGGEDWLLEPLLAKGRAHAFYAGHKTGKSLMLLWAAAKLATGDQPVVVIYLDYEMTEDDLQERIEDMGYSPDDDLTRLRYALLPMLAPLDSPAGGDALVDIVDTEQARWPDHHLVVIIDTTSRAVSGEENSADTIRAFYRETGMRLKQRGVTWVRVDHAGKDATKGQRGSSAKGDDVDVVWLVTAGDRGSLLLTRKAARMGWVPEKVTLARSEAPLAYTPDVGNGWPAGTAECAIDLDNLAAPLDIGRPKAGELLRHAGKKHANAVVGAALRFRRQPRPLTSVGPVRDRRGQVPAGTETDDEGEF